jgi:hypothetical protein
MSVRVWALSGETLAEAYGHTALIYTVAATPGGLIASGGLLPAIASMGPLQPQHPDAAAEGGGRRW